MLGFAAKFMDGKDKEDEATKHLIEGLDGIYVRSYEFEKEGQYSAVDVEKLRSYFEAGGEWSSIVRERDKKSGESTDVMMKMINGQPHGTERAEHRADPWSGEDGGLEQAVRDRRAWRAGRCGGQREQK